MRARRHGGPSFMSTMAGRRLVRQAGVVLLALATGYLISFIWFPPGPLLSADHAVPRVWGDKVDAARKKIEEQGFRVKLAREAPHPVAAPGVVVWQDPPAGVVLGDNGQVTLTPSSGPAPVAVPDVIGFDGALAEKVLIAGGLVRGATDSLPSSDTRGSVVATRPGPGVGRNPGSSVAIVVSAGPAEISVPDVIGMTTQQARERLEQADLKVVRVSYRSRPDRPDGVVIEQRPGPGTLSAAGGGIELIIARRGDT